MAIPKHRVAAAVVVLNEENNILLIKGPIRGWEYPGGYVEEGESIRAGAIREVKEESGVDVQLTKFCGIYHDVASSICIYLFLGIPISGELKTSNESVDVGYYSITEALQMVTWKNYREKLELCLQEDVQPFFIEC